MGSCEYCDKEFDARHFESEHGLSVYERHLDTFHPDNIAPDIEWIDRPDTLGETYAPLHQSSNSSP